MTLGSKKSPVINVHAVSGLVRAKIKRPFVALYEHLNSVQENQLCRCRYFQSRLTASQPYASLYNKTAPGVKAPGVINDLLKPGESH
mgnify:CR=1 FL=1